MRAIALYVQSMSGAVTTIGLLLLGIGSALDSWPYSICGAIGAATGVAIQFGRAEVRHRSLTRATQDAMAAVAEFRADLHHQTETLQGELSELRRDLDYSNRHVDDRLVAIGERLDATKARMDGLDEIAAAHDRSLEVVNARRAWTSSRASLARRSELHLSESFGTLEDTQS